MAIAYLSTQAGLRIQIRRTNSTKNPASMLLPMLIRLSTRQGKMCTLWANLTERTHWYNQL